MRLAGVLTTLWQHALLHLLQLLCAVAELHGGLERTLSSPQTFAAGHTAVTPFRPRGQQAGDCICTRQEFTARVFACEIVSFFPPQETTTRRGRRAATVFVVLIKETVRATVGISLSKT